MHRTRNRLAITGLLVLATIFGRGLPIQTTPESASPARLTSGDITSLLQLYGEGLSLQSLAGEDPCVGDCAGAIINGDTGKCVSQQTYKHKDCPSECCCSFAKALDLNPVQTAGLRALSRMAEAYIPGFRLALDRYYFATENGPGLRPTVAQRARGTPPWLKDTVGVALGIIGQNFAATATESDLHAFAPERGLERLR